MIVRLVAALLAFVLVYHPTASAWGDAPAAKPPASTVTALHAFFTTNHGPDGANPQAALIADSSGALYGTTVWGGTANLGTVFKVAPPAPGQTEWTETVLHSFASDGADGSTPQGRLLLDSAGALYGTTSTGGAHGSGTVFKLTPPAPGSSAWMESVIYAFDHTARDHDGALPMAGLIRDGAGNLYGTTAAGGTKDAGTVFELVPPPPGQTAWTETVLHDFAPAQGDGGQPTGELLADAGGSLYGTTATGGALGVCASSPRFGCGTVFKLSPPPPGQQSWTEAVLHSFVYSDGAYPRAGLIADARGNLYGTTSQGGPAFCEGKFDFETCGTVFELSPPAPGQTAWKNRVLHVFVDARGDGNFPFSNLITDAAGSLYGTTVFGGTAPRCSGQRRRLPDNCGTVFKLTPPPAGQTGWSESVLYSFDQTGPGGAQPRGGLLADANGTLYGTAYFGGGTPHCLLVLQSQPQFCGTVFALSVPSFAAHVPSVRGGRSSTRPDHVHR